MNKGFGKTISVRPLKLGPILPIILCYENKDGTQNVLHVGREDVSVTNTAEGGTVYFQLRGEKAGIEGARAEPAAGSVHVEHALEYFCVEII